MGHATADKSKAKMRAAKLGREQSQEHKAAISAANMGRVFTDETRAKIAAGNKGQPKSAAHRAALMEAWGRRKASALALNQANIRQFAFNFPPPTRSLPL